MHRLFLREVSHFHINKVVKAYIIADTILWGAWNLFTPIFAIFVVRNINGGNIEAAASGYSVYLISRIIFELLSAHYLARRAERAKFQTTVIGLLCLSLSYIGFAFSQSIFDMFFYYIIAGFALGIATPAKSALFSIHLDKHREATEWGITDATAYICIAITTILGSIIAKHLGFRTLFLFASIVNLVATLPYLQFLPFGKKYIFTHH